MSNATELFGIIFSSSGARLKNYSYDEFSSSRYGAADRLTSRDNIRHAAEIESKLTPYGTTFDDYNEIIIQFGYVSLFLVVLPSVPLIALITNIVEIKCVSRNT